MLTRMVAVVVCGLAACASAAAADPPAPPSAHVWVTTPGSAPQWWSGADLRVYG